MIRTLKIRLLPTPEQEQMFWNHIGAARFIYNHMLAEQIRRREAGEKNMSEFDMNKLLTEMKQQDPYRWFFDVSARVLQRVCADLSEAYSNFFAHRRVSRSSKARRKQNRLFQLRTVSVKSGFPKHMFKFRKSVK